MDNFPAGEEIRADARRDFQEYYRLATPRDIALLDALVMARAALVVGYTLAVKVPEK